MLPNLPFPETQATLALSVFLFTFAYEDGATLLAAALAAAGRLDVRLGLLSAFLGIWIGDIGLYALGSSLGRRAMQSRWLGRFLPAERLAKAEMWFARRGALTIIMSRFVPGSRLGLYVAAGVLKHPARRFATLTGVCSAIWVSSIFVLWHFTPRSSFGSGKTAPWILAIVGMLLPWLVGKIAVSAFRRVRILYGKCRQWDLRPALAFGNIFARAVPVPVRAAKFR